MKIKITSLFILVLFGITQQSCNKDEMLPENLSNSSLPSHRSADSDECDEMDLLCIQDGMIVVSDTAVFRKIVSFIDARHKIWIQIYSGNSITGEYKVTKKFEQRFNHSSLQGLINNQRENWLGQTTLDISNDPDDKWIEGTGLRTILNENGVVKIGNEIYVARRGGNTFVITDGSLTTLNLILSGQETGLSKTLLYKASGEVIDAETGSITIPVSECIGFYQTTGEVLYGNNRRVKGKTGIYSFVFFSSITTETDHFRKLGPIWYKQKADFIQANGGGNLYDSDCREKGTLSIFDNGNNKNTISDSRTYWGLGNTRRLKQTEWSSTHYSEDGGNQSPILQLDI